MEATIVRGNANIIRGNANKVFALKKAGKTYKEIANEIGVKPYNICHFFNHLKKEKDITAQIVNPEIVEYIEKNSTIQATMLKKTIKEKFNVALSYTLIAKYLEINQPANQPAKQIEINQPAEKTNILTMPNFTIIDGIIRIENNAKLKVSFDGKHYTFSL